MFKKIILDLLATDLTEKQIAEEVGCSQPNINRIVNEDQEPKGGLAIALLKFHEKRCKKKAA
jgi:predicted transcriptional regulator